MSDQQAAAEAMRQWAPVVRWLEDVERTIPSAPLIGGVDEDQISETEDAIRAARLAVASLVGSYATETQQPAPTHNTATQQTQTASQMWSQRQQVTATRPGDNLQQNQQAQPQAQPEHYPQYAGGWQ